tara:strand:- start:2185 stop:2673 length:489 start_codon:yes stop_codon:yes gene_type:complete
MEDQQWSELLGQSEYLAEDGEYAFKALGSADEKKKAILEILKSLSVRMVTVPFEGGNDEGFIEASQLEMESGDKREVKEAYREWNPKLRCYEWPNGEEPSELVQRESRLAELLSYPINASYGSFAGEFSVDGAFVWNVETGHTGFQQHISSHQYNEEEWGDE